MLLVFLKNCFWKKKSWSSDVSGDLINRDLRGACACPAATAVQWSDGNRFGAGEVYRSGWLLSFFPKDDNLGVLKSTATTCVRMRGWVSGCMLGGWGGRRPRRVPAGPDFEKYPRSYARSCSRIWHSWVELIWQLEFCIVDVSCNQFLAWKTFSVFETYIKIFWDHGSINVIFEKIVS